MEIKIIFHCVTYFSAPNTTLTACNNEPTFNISCGADSVDHIRCAQFSLDTIQMAPPTSSSTISVFNGQSSLSCASKCFEHENCVSFNFDKVTMLCTFYDKIYNTGLEISTNARYYTQQ